MNVWGLMVAFIAGLISITSPCCLPLLPGYLGYLTGLDRREATNHRWRVFTAAALFVTGFTLVFVALGATASELGSLIFGQRPALDRLAGAVILVMGLILLAEGRIGLVSRGGDWSQHWAKGQLWAAAPLGAAFAITWTPCIGPVLGAILTLASSTQSIAEGSALLLVYSLGLAVPFLALSIWVEPARAVLARLGRTMAVAQGVSGALLVAMGVLVLTDRWLPLISPVLAFYARLRWPPI
ncbi:MAG: cytochrome c biogenesis protein CcdA [Chloroflexota bacterium]